MVLDCCWVHPGFRCNALKAQNPLEQLEAKLLQQEKAESNRSSDSSSGTSNSETESLPRPPERGKSLLVNPPSLPSSPPSSNSNNRPLNATSRSEASALSSAEPDTPYLGMTLERPIGGGLGLRVVEVVNQSPAWKSGFRLDDRILGIGGVAVSDIEAFAREMANVAPNDLVKFLVERRGRQMEIKVVMIPRSMRLVPFRMRASTRHYQTQCRRELRPIECHPARHFRLMQAVLSDRARSIDRRFSSTIWNSHFPGSERFRSRSQLSRLSSGVGTR